MKRYKLVKPSYYDQFSCKGGDCRYTCCQGWNITLSKEEYRKIKRKTAEWPEKNKQKYFQKMPPEYRKKEEENRIALNDGLKCPFLTKQQLCELQCKFGADILPSTCKRYPRSNHLYIDEILQTLSPGCERVLELSFREKKIQFIKEEKLSDILPCNSRITPNMTAHFPIFQYRNDILSLCLVILQAEGIILEDRLFLLGISVRHIEEMGREGNFSEIPAYINRYIQTLSVSENIEAQLPKPKANPLILLHNLNIAQRRQTANDIEYSNMLSAIQESLHLKMIQDSTEGEISFSSERYLLLRDKYQDFMSGREHFMENLLVTALLYMNLPFCPPISDSIWDNYMYLAWIYSIVKLCLTACMDNIHTEQDFIHYCSVLMRSWAHNNIFARMVIENFQKNGSDTLAHIAALLYS